MKTFAYVVRRVFAFGTDWYISAVLINLMTNATSLTQSPVSKTIMVIAGVVLVLFAIFLIGWSLSWKIAGKSLLIIFMVYFGIYTL